MTAREFDPSRLDVVVFAREAGELAGAWPLARFERLAESAVSGAPLHEAGEVRWSARGEQRPVRGGEPQPWLRLEASTHIALECQRCLKPVDVPLQVARDFLFVHGEDAAAQLDADSDDDVLAITRALDLQELIEDELLLALPIVPRHEVCPDPLVPPTGELDSDAEPAPHPFAALAGLKRSGLN